MLGVLFLPLVALGIVQSVLAALLLAPLPLARPVIRITKQTRTPAGWTVIATVSVILVAFLISVCHAHHSHALPIASMNDTQSGQSACNIKVQGLTSGGRLVPWTAVLAVHLSSPSTAPNHVQALYEIAEFTGSGRRGAMESEIMHRRSAFAHHPKRRLKRRIFAEAA